MTENIKLSFHSNKISLLVVHQTQCSISRTFCCGGRGAEGTELLSTKGAM